MNTNSIYIRSLPWLLAWVVLAWFAGTWLHFAGTDLWLFRGAMILLGVAAWIGYIWYKSSHPTLQSGGEDVDVAVSEAELKLQASGLGRLANLPAFLLLGESGSAKTTTILRSGLDVELLSGLDQRDGSVIPTQSLNLWVGQKHVMIDPAGNLLRDPESRKRLIRKLESFQMSNVVAKGKLASRAAIVCISCDSFLGQGAADTAVALARHTREILGELCRAWKVRLPVYVLFTKLDLLTHFTEYAANLTEEEAAQVFGCMLAMDSESSETYSQRETQRMTDAFIDLEVRLRTRRLDLLGRENDENKLPSIYEFPREFGKMRSPVVNYLVDLCRPSQLSASLNPFLRGFYFVGVRPVAVTEASPVRVAPEPRRAFDANATSVFLRSGGMTGANPAPPPAPTSARKPQWVFLQHVLPRVVLGDRMALNFSQTSTKVGMWQSGLLAAVALSGIAMGALWGVSFYKNYNLGSRVVDSSRALAQSGASTQPPSLETLRALDRLREPVETLAAYERSGHPASMGWGLYTGSDLFDPAYRSYFSYFQKILLSPTQAKLVGYMDRPNQTAGFQEVYDALKAYLITTSHPDKSTRDFLPPILVKHWSRDQNLDQDRIQLSTGQFQFYSEELPLKRPGMPVSAESQGPVTRTRVFLNSSLDPTPVYNRIVADVSTALGKFVFKKEHPGSESAVIEKYDVPGAFTKKGWDQMQVKLNDRKEYFSGEEWVVQSQQYAKIDPTKMAQALQALYLDDFVKNWRQYLHDGSVLSYASYGDAADKLQSLSGNQSPLLSLLCDASENTAVDNPSVAQLFDAPHQVVPPGCNKLLKSGNNTAYYEALGQLQSAMDTLKSNATSETAQAAAASSVGHANTEVGNLARGFRPDKDGHVDGMTQTLLHQPIQYAQDLLIKAPLTEANGKAKSLCTGFQALMQKYPFRPDSTVQASVQEVGDFFRPKDGALWSFYQEVGAKVLVSQGSDIYAPKPESPTATRGFAQFFSGAAGVSHAFFPPDASGPNPALKFSVRIVHSDDIVSAELNAGQQTVAYPSDAASALTWPSPKGGQQITLQVTFTGGAGGVNFGSSDGPWAIFDFFTKKGEDWKNLNPSKATLNRISRDGNVPITLLNGHRQMVQLEVDTNGAPMILKPEYFKSLASCPTGQAVQ